MGSDPDSDSVSDPDPDPDPDPDSDPDPDPDSAPAPAAAPSVRFPDTSAASASPAPIAIIGAGCRFPGGGQDLTDLDSFWRFLREGGDATITATREGWRDDDLFDPDPRAAGKLHVRRGGFLAELESFDPELFGISPREAARMDPQQRLLLECTWEALEHAGQPPTGLAGSLTGVFVSAATNQYLERFTAELAELDAYALTGNLPCTLSGRISYALGLRGPNLALDTGCSGALVALHLACQSLRAGECELALAAGVNALLSTELMIGLSKTGSLSPGGRCKTFDAAADGFARGEGCGVVVLKRLADAERDGDRVLAVVRGTAVNHDGKSSGLTVPSGPAQRALLERALQQAGVAAAEVGFVEAHGTGTALGDPIEMGALTAVYGKASGRSSPLLVGAVKSNLGHLEAAAGIAGLLKTALVLEHGEVPPNLHLETPSPRLPLEGEPVELPTAPRPWPHRGRRLAAVSSFGLGGTNAHAVLEAAPPPAPSAPASAYAIADRPAHVVALSAHSEAALREQARRLAAQLRERGEELSLPDLAFSTATCRAVLPHRLATAVCSASELVARLEAFSAAPGATSDVFTGAVADAGAPRIGFLYPGQGSQYAGMGKELYLSQPVVREAIDRCAAVLDRKGEVPLLQVLADASAIDRTGRAQPALFALQYALTCLWRSWGVEPHAVFGHSVGELAAAVAAEALPLDLALRLVAARARHMERLPAGGAMASVRASADEVAAALAAEAGAHAEAKLGAAPVAIAAINGPEHVVISGEEAAVSRLAAGFRARGVETKALRVSVAFHSAALDPILEPFQRDAARVLQRRRAAERAADQPFERAWFSGLTGEAMTPRQAGDPAYWRRQMREPVQLPRALTAMREHGCQLFLELGPHPTLTNLAAETLPAELPCIPSLRRGHRDSEQLARALGRLFVAGVPVDWRAWDRPFARQRVPLPSYPFQRRRLWFPLPPRRRAAVAATAEAAPIYARVEWRDAPLRAAPPQGGHWILLGAESELARALGAELARRGATSARHSLAELSSVRFSDRPLAGLIHLGALDLDASATASASASPAPLLAAQEQLLGSALAAAQALVAAPAGPARLWLVSRGAVATGEGEATSLALAQASLWGFGAVVGSEHPERWGGCLDLDPAASASAAAAALADEVLAADGETRVAWRDGARKVARLVPTALPPAPGAPPALRGEARYLVTGGRGALGLVAARWLVERGARHLILVGRGQPDQAALAATAELEARGARVDHERCDVADAAALAALIDRLRQASPRPLAGLIHAAGIVEDGLLQGQRWPAVQRVLAPKLGAAWQLYRLLPELELVLYFSSAAALLGPHGQLAYAAANAFLDALATRQRAERPGATIVSIGWGPWQLGMAARLAGEAPRAALAAWRPLDAAGGQRALDELRAGALAHVAVLPLAGRALHDELARVPFTRELLPSAPDDGDGTGAAADSSSQRAAAAPRWRDELTAAPAAERRRLLEQRARALVERTLGWQGQPGEGGLGAARRFVEVGMDSLMAVEIRNQLQRELGLSLAATSLFNYPTLAALTQHLDGKLAASGLAMREATEAAPPPAPSTAAAPSAPAAATAPAASTAELSDDELAALIAQRFSTRP